MVAAAIGVHQPEAPSSIGDTERVRNEHHVCRAMLSAGRGANSKLRQAGSLPIEDHRHSDRLVRVERPVSQSVLLISPSKHTTSHLLVLLSCFFFDCLLSATRCRQHVSRHRPWSRQQRVFRAILVPSEAVFPSLR